MSICPPNRAPRNFTSDQVPWATYPKPKLLSQPISAKAPTVVVCMTGQARTLAHPAVWQSIRSNLLDDGRIDLIAVLGTGSDVLSRQSIDDQRLAAPDWLALALHHLRPLHLRLILNAYSSRTPCPTKERAKEESTAQLLSWGDCAQLVQRAGHDWMFRTRADIFWEVPMRLATLAHHLEPDVVVTSNDHHMLVSRSGLPALALLRQLTPGQCARQFGDLCMGQSPVYGGQFSNYNNYCLQVAHLAHSRLRHIETSHPGCAAGEQPLHLHIQNIHPLLRPLSYRTGANQHIVRWALPQPPRQPRGTRILCRVVPGRSVRCKYCGGAPPPHGPCAVPAGAH